MNEEIARRDRKRETEREREKSETRRASVTAKARTLTKGQNHLQVPGYIRTCQNTRRRWEEYR